MSPLPLIDLPANAEVERQQVVAQVLGFLPHTWKTRMEFWDPDFALAQYQLLEAFEE